MRAAVRRRAALIEISQASGIFVDAGRDCRIAPPAIAGAMKLIQPGPRRKPPARQPPGKQHTSVAEFQLLGDGLVAGEIRGVKIIQQAAALAHHFQEAAARTMIFDVLLQMLGQVVNPFRQKRHLHISRPGVALMDLKTAYGLSFFHIQFN